MDRELDPLRRVRFILGAIKSSLEISEPWRRISEKDVLARELWKTALLRLEEARLELRTMTSIGAQRKWPTHEILNRWPATKVNVTSLVQDLLTNKAFRKMAEHTRFRPPGPERGNIIYENIETVENALVLTLHLLESINPDKPANAPQKLIELRELVPHQKVSPVQFSIDRGRLVIAHQRTYPDAEDLNNVQSSRDALLNRGNKLVEELQRSNCDRRLLQCVTELQHNLESCENVVQLGIMNIGVEAMCHAFDAELPDALRGMLIGHTRGITMYVAQFPQWQRFSEKAASIDLDVDDIEQVSETAKRLADELENHPEIADSEVPKTIRALQKLIENPKLAAKRAAFAVLRTIENLVAKVLEYCTEFFEKTADKTVECLSGAASKAIVGTLMALALTGALGISPLSTKITDTAWLKAAAEVVQNEIEAMKM